MSDRTGPVPARQPQIVLRPVPGSPCLFRRNRDVPRLRRIWDYAQTNAREGLHWPKPTTEAATVAVVRAILTDSEQAVDEYASSLV